MVVKNLLKSIRHQLEIDSQKEMGKRLGISQQQYNRYENQECQPTLEKALEISEKLNLPVERLFYIEKNPE